MFLNNPRDLERFNTAQALSARRPGRSGLWSLRTFEGLLSEIQSGLAKARRGGGGRVPTTTVLAVAWGFWGEAGHRRAMALHR